MRLFVAVDPGEQVRRRLSAWLDAGRRRWPLRWVRPDQLHLTLQFLGEQPPAAVETLAAAYAAVAAGRGPVRLAFGEIGAFPGWRRPRVLVLHVDGGPALAELAAAVRAAGEAAAAGDRPDRKPWRPHLTLARFRGRADPGVVAELRGWRPEPPPSVVADRFALVESRLEPGGARYRVVAEFPLAGNPAP